jgi:hypothetical protein
MIVLLNPWSTPSPKKPLPMSLLALGSMLDGEFEYTIIDGNIEPDAAGAIIAIADKRPITAIAVTVMPGPQLRAAVSCSRQLNACCRACRSSGAATFPPNMPMRA